MQILKYFYMLLASLIFSSNLIYAQEPIKSASEYDYPPFSIVTETGEADGFSIELLRASLRAVGLDVEFYVGPWTKIKQDLAHGKIQVLPLVGRTPERESIYDFSVPYKTSYGGIFVRNDEIGINTLQDLSDKKVLVMKGDNAHEFLLRENVSKYIFTTESLEDAFKMLSKGKYDAVVAQQMVGRQLIDKLGIKNVILKSRIDQYKQDWTFAVKQGNKELLASLNNGLSITITNGTFDIIHDKWFEKIKTKKQLKDGLTSKENAFLASHPVIKLGIDGSWGPYIYENQDGSLKGFNIDYINLINKYTGTNIQLEVGPWADIVKKAKNRSIDGLSVSGPIKEREPFFNFSDIYVSEFILILSGTDNRVQINSAADLAGKTIAMQKGNEYYSTFLQSIGNVKIVDTETESASIKYMLEGKADHCVSSITTFAELRENYLNLVKLSYVVTEKPLDIVFSIRKDWPELVSIVNKGLDSISEEKRKKIYNRWFGIPISANETPPEAKEKFFFAKKSIQQKAEDLARQVEIYLNAYPDKTLKELQNDPEFQKIAIQPVGETGYTAISDFNNLVILFHPNKDLVGLKIEDLSKNYPVMWELVQQAKGGNDISGVYQFPDLDGVIKDKYLYIKIVKTKTADEIGLWVAATTYLDEYDQIELQKKEKERFPILPLVWGLGILTAAIFFLLVLNKLNIIKLEKNAIILFLSIALLLIIGLFIYNAYNISENLQKSAISNYFDTLRATASNKRVNIEQHIAHLKNSFKIFSSRMTISNEDFMEAVKTGEDFIEFFNINRDGEITHSSDPSHIGLSRLSDAYFNKAIKQIYIKPIYLSNTTKEVLFTISAPYKKGVIVARINLDYIQKIITQKEGLRETGESLLAYRDTDGDAVFFTQRRFTSQAESRDIIPKEDTNIPITQALLGNEKEFSNYVDYRGVPVFAVTMYIDELDAGLVVKIDQKEALKSVSGSTKQIWYSTTVIIFAIIIIGIIFYFLLTYSLRNEVENKTQALEKASEGLSEQIGLLQHSEKNLIESQGKVKASLKEKEVLLRELYHRTKNNMQVIISMINLQVDNIQDKNSLTILKETTNKINAMALVHEKLYQTKDLSRIDLKDYFNDLFSLLQNSYYDMSEKVQIKTDMDKAMVSIDSAIPCGLIINELISNTFKHAYPGDLSGEIQILLKTTQDDEIEIIVSDDGKGLPPELDYRNANSLGLRTVIALVEQQLSGSIEHIRDNGTRLKILFRDQQQARI